MKLNYAKREIERNLRHGGRRHYGRDPKGPVIDAQVFTAESGAAGLLSRQAGLLREGGAPVAGADLRREEVTEEDLGAREAPVRPGRGDRRDPEGRRRSHGGHRTGEEEERQVAKEAGQDKGGVVVMYKNTISFEMIKL